MQRKEWETTVQQIADESNRQPTEAGKQQVLTAWRTKLQQQPTALQAFQIDQIVREVRKKLIVAKVATSPETTSALIGA